MFNWLKKDKLEDFSNEEDSEINVNSDIASGFATADSVRSSVIEAGKTYAKPETYTGNRNLFDSGTAKANVKIDSFKTGKTVKDPYTNQNLELRKIDAKAKYGSDWQNHLAEGDHITPVEKVFSQTKDNQWIKTDDIKNITNSKDNLQTVSRKFNNAKRNRTNEDFVNDTEYLERTGVKLGEGGKERAIEAGRKSQAIIDKKVRQTGLNNALKTGHEAGVQAGTQAGITALTISTGLNLVDVLKGKKTVKQAMSDIAKDGGKAALTGYVVGNGLTILGHSLANSSSSFIRALSESNVPGKVVAAVMATGSTLVKYGNGEITTEECLIELGNTGANIATMGYSMAVGQALIPIPVVGAAVGALVGSVVTTTVYNSLIGGVVGDEKAHRQRLMLIEEYKTAAEKEREFRSELEGYLENYFKDYQNCFDEALGSIRTAWQAGDADGVIAGANKITEKLGGKVHYNNVNEFKSFLSDDSMDVL